VEASPGLAAALRGILGAVLQLTTARRSPLDLLLFLEVCCLLLAFRCLLCCTAA
jgi:hypothetical protein